MNWPVSQDYNEAIQIPSICFADRDLKDGEVVSNVLGLPTTYSGNFADVYQIKSSNNKSWAVKCFTRNIDGLTRRYAQISARLNLLQLPFVVDFTFLEKGILIRGKWFPVVKMEWVDGLSLNEFVAKNADRPAILKATLDLWVRMAVTLRESEIAHADLQHGNVLLVPVGPTSLMVKLVDYDGMWVSALQSYHSGESGHSAYQHPLRMETSHWGPELDRFPHLVVVCALRSLVIGGLKLWEDFDNGDNLLFRSEDFRNPRSSRLIKTLWDMPDQGIRGLLAHLVLSSQRPVSHTPCLSDLIIAGVLPEPSRSQEEQMNQLLGRKDWILEVPLPETDEHAPALQTEDDPPTNREFAKDFDKSKLKTGIVAIGIAAGLALTVIVLIAILTNSTSSTKKAQAEPKIAHALPLPSTSISSAPKAKVERLGAGEKQTTPKTVRPEGTTNRANKSGTKPNRPANGSNGRAVKPERPFGGTPERATAKQGQEKEIQKSQDQEEEEPVLGAETKRKHDEKEVKDIAIDVKENKTKKDAEASRIKKEKEAELLLSTGKILLENPAKRGKALEYFEKVVTNYPGTPAAKQARKLIDSISKPED